MKRRVPYAVGNYEEIVEGGYYFVDKTAYLRQLESYKVPNQTMRAIFADYYNTLARIEVTQGYVPYFEQFLVDLDLEKLFAGYWEVYVGQLPAQLFVKMNENIFRTTFSELCSRFLERTFTLVSR